MGQRIATTLLIAFVGLGTTHCRQKQVKNPVASKKSSGKKKDGTSADGTGTCVKPDAASLSLAGLPPIDAQKLSITRPVLSENFDDRRGYELMVSFKNNKLDAAGNRRGNYGFAQICKKRPSNWNQRNAGCETFRIDTDQAGLFRGKVVLKDTSIKGDVWVGATSCLDPDRILDGAAACDQTWAAQPQVLDGYHLSKLRTVDLAIQKNERARGALIDKLYPQAVAFQESHQRQPLTGAAKDKEETLWAAANNIRQISHMRVATATPHYETLERFFSGVQSKLPAGAQLADGTGSPCVTEDDITGGDDSDGVDDLLAGMDEDDAFGGSEVSTPQDDGSGNDGQGSQSDAVESAEVGSSPAAWDSIEITEDKTVQPKDFDFVSAIGLMNDPPARSCLTKTASDVPGDSVILDMSCNERFTFKRFEAANGQSLTQFQFKSGLCLTAVDSGGGELGLTRAECLDPVNADRADLMNQLFLRQGQPVNGQNYYQIKHAVHGTCLATDAGTGTGTELGELALTGGSDDPAEGTVDGAGGDAATAGTLEPQLKPAFRTCNSTFQNALEQWFSFESYDVGGGGGGGRSGTKEKLAKAGAIMGIIGIASVAALAIGLGVSMTKTGDDFFGKKLGMGGTKTNYAAGFLVFTAVVGLVLGPILSAAGVLGLAEDNSPLGAWQRQLTSSQKEHENLMTEYRKLKAARAKLVAAAR